MIKVYSEFDINNKHKWQFKNINLILGFISLEKFPNIEIPIFLDESEWYNWKEKGDPVLHIDLRKWADIFLIAPLSANTMGKIKNGICDNLLVNLLFIVKFFNYNYKLISIYRLS